MLHVPSIKLEVGVIRCEGGWWRSGVRKQVRRRGSHGVGRPGKNPAADVAPSRRRADGDAAVMVPTRVEAGGGHGTGKPRGRLVVAAAPTQGKAGGGAVAMARLRCRR